MDKTYTKEMRRLEKIGLVANNPTQHQKKSKITDGYGCSCGGCGACGGCH